MYFTEVYHLWQWTIMTVTHIHKASVHRATHAHTGQRLHFPAFLAGRNDPQWRGSKMSQDTFLMRHIFHVEKQHAHVLCHIYRTHMLLASITPHRGGGLHSSRETYRVFTVELMRQTATLCAFSVKQTTENPLRGKHGIRVQGGTAERSSGTHL